MADFDYYNLMDNMAETCQNIIGDYEDNNKSSSPKIENQNLNYLKPDKSENKLIICKYCNAINSIVYDSENYYYICRECGNVNEESDLNYEYINQEKDKDDYSKQIYNKSTITKAFYKSVKSQGIRNIYKWNMTTFREMEEQKIRKLIYKSCEILKLKKCISDDAMILYKLVVANHTTEDLKGVELRRVTYRGTNKIGIIGSCIYYACKKNSFNKSVREIAICLHITTKLLNKSCNSFLKSVEAMKYDYDFNVSVPEDYLNSYQMVLSIPSKDMNLIRQILLNIEKCHYFNTKVPHIKALISIIVYLKNNNYGITQQKLCDTTGISRITLLQLTKESNIYYNQLFYGEPLENEIIQNDTITTDSDDIESVINTDQDLEDKLKEINKIDEKHFINNLYLDKILEFLN